MARDESAVSCIACGRRLDQSQAATETLIDPGVRHVFPRWGCSSFVHYDGPSISSPLDISSIR
jgi:hypothetical protein